MMIPSTGASRLSKLLGWAIVIALVAAPLDALEPVDVYSEENSEGAFEFYVDSDHSIPVWLHLEFENLVNLDTETQLPFRGLIEPGTVRRHLFTLEPTQRSGRRGYSISYSYARGDPREVEHNDDHHYLLPFAHGEKFQVSQGYYGEFTHYGENTYALDFDMEIGTPVHAARDGTVVEVKQDSNVGGPSARYDGHANYILIQHADGSYGNYVHLKQNGAVVEPGDEVRAGRHIGYSGNTGRSSGPHLHFDVRVPQKDGRMQSIPTRFIDHSGETVRIEENRFYYASHPGGEPFEVVLGSDLRDEDFADHLERVAHTDSIELRTEQLDHTYVLFIANGFEEEMEVEISIRKQGLRATRALPLVLTIPARSEKYVTLLRADPEASRLQFTPRIRYKPRDS